MALDIGGPDAPKVPDNVSKTDYYLWAGTAVKSAIDFTQDHHVDAEIVKEMMGEDKRRPIPTLEAYFEYVHGRQNEKAKPVPPLKEDDASSRASSRSRHSESRSESKASSRRSESRSKASSHRPATPRKGSKKDDSSFPSFTALSEKRSSEKKKADGPSFLPEMVVPNLPEPEPAREEEEEPPREEEKPKGREREEYDYGFASAPSDDEEEERREKERESEPRPDEEEEPRRETREPAAMMTDEEDEVESRPATSQKLKYIDEVPMSEELTKNLKIREVIDCELRLDMLELSNDPDDARKVEEDRRIRNNRYKQLQAYSLRDLTTYHNTLEDDIYIKNDVAGKRWYFQKSFNVLEEGDKMLQTRALTGLCKDVENTREGWHMLDGPFEQIARSKRRTQMNPYVAIGLAVGKILGSKILENKVLKGKKFALDALTDGPPSSAMEVPPPPPMVRSIEPPPPRRPKDAERRYEPPRYEAVYRSHTEPSGLSNRNVDPSRTQPARYDAPTAQYAADMDPSGEHVEDGEEIVVPVM